MVLSLFVHMPFQIAGALIEVALPSTVVGDNISVYSFSRANNLKKILIDEENKDYEVINGVLYRTEKNGSILEVIPEGIDISTFTLIPGKNYSTMCNQNLKEVKNIIIPDECNFKFRDFINCTNLEKIEILGKVSQLTVFKLAPRSWWRLCDL